MRPTVAIVGRPNVGKSTLFNRLVGKRLALVDDTPGVTRDRREGDARLGDLDFTVVDTAGLEEAEAESLTGRMRLQTEAAIRDADVVLFLVDSRVGVTPIDGHFAELVRRSDTPVILVANKAEGRAGEAGAYEAFGLGFGDPVPLSAEHGEGMADLYEALRPYIDAVAPPRDETEPEPDGEDETPEARAAKPLRIAVVGRPNAGKSTLVNALIGEDRMLTGPEAGITRDSVSVDWEWRGRRIKLFDTAGMRRKARVQDKLEKLSVADTLRAIRFAEVVVLCLDATTPFEKQDLQIADLVVREGRAIVIALDKWDLVEDRVKAWKDLRETCERLLPQIRGVPLVRLSGLTGEGLDELMKAVIKVEEVWTRRVSTAQVNRWLEHVLQRHPPPAVSGRRIKIRYATQAKTRPPTFAIFCSRPDALPDSYTRYLANDLRETFDLAGIPLRLNIRGGGENPYDKKKDG
ncbi:ribosome biogenesis GTPase Der [Prosthecomicrobium sp. N25]|uniref:ribosome biogenesis GTPase Der n=1 Tax=Prosthecomicrobium sp. N25 TaxID=3129254 RepID=UPI003077E589